jgi:hypothetical protein
MSAVNIKGTSNTSLPSEFFRTKPDVPSSVPQILLAQAINSTAIRVRWMVSLISFYIGLNKMNLIISADFNKRMEFGFFNGKRYWLYHLYQ